MSQPDFAALLQQAQALQDKLRQMQEAAAAKTVSATTGGGLVKVEVDGTMQVRRIEIDPALLTTNDKVMIEDLVTAAINDGLRQARDLVASEMGKLGGPLAGLRLPGFNND